MTLGEFIRNYRERKDLSMEEFAKRAGMSKPYISMLESNKNSKTGKPIAPSIKTIQKCARAMNMTFDNLMRAIDQDIDITPSAPAELEYTDEEKGIITGYRKAPDPLKEIVRFTLKDYMKDEAPATPPKEQPKNVEAAAVAVAIPEKAKTIIAFLKPFGIDCEYLDYEPTFGEPGDFMAMTTVFDKFQGEEGRPHSSSICSRPLEGLYEELKPVMDASGMKRKALIDKFIADTFQRDIVLAEGMTYRDAYMLNNVSKKVAGEYHGVIDEDGNPRLERIKSNEAPTDKKPAKKKAAEG